jgi:hypothetical protein
MDNLQNNQMSLYLGSGQGIPYNSPSGTWQSHIYPFSTDETLRKKFMKFDGKELQVGIFLEEIDAICAESAKRYFEGQPGCEDAGVVTAAVDHLDFKNLKLQSNYDTKINVSIMYNPYRPMSPM